MKNVYQYQRIIWKIVCMCVLTGSLFCVNGPENKAAAQRKNQKTEKSAASADSKAVGDSVSLRIIFGQQLNLLLSEQKKEEAIALFETLSEEEQDSLAIQNLKAAVLISVGRIAEAEKMARALEKRYPKDINVLYTMTMLAQAKNDAKMRTTYLKKILRIDPNNVQALQEEGLDLYNQGSYKEAGIAFSKILKKHPNDIQALIWCGKVYYLDNKLKEAEQCFRVALQQEPKNSLAIAELARIKSETNRMAEAISDIKEAIALEPDAAPHWTDLGSYNMQIGRREDALDAFNHAVALVPDSYFIHIYLAGLNDDLGNKDAAIKHYQKVVELYPQYYFAYEGLGILYFERKEWENSRRAFVNALRYAPDNTYYALTAALCSYKLDKKADAKDFMSKYLKTVDRTKHENEYFLCRLFVDLAGDSDVNNRIAKESEETDRLRKSFYLAEFYQLIGKGHIAEKYLLDITTTQTPTFFEYRLAVSELPSGAGKAKTN